MFIHGGSWDLENELFQRAQREFKLVLVEARNVTAIWGKKVNVIEHKADVLRLEALLHFGGIYSDLDVIWLKSPSIPISPDVPALTSYEFTISQESGNGLCNVKFFILHSNFILH